MKGKPMGGWGAALGLIHLALTFKRLSSSQVKKQRQRKAENCTSSLKRRKICWQWKLEKCQIALWKGEWWSGSLGVGHKHLSSSTASSNYLCLHSYLFPIKAKSTKRKTPVVKKNLNPHYDHTFVYKGLTLEQLKGMCLELTVWDREPMLSNEFLGGVRLSSGRGKIVQSILTSSSFTCPGLACEG